MKSLSIMIPTIVGREVCFSDLVCGLIQQCGTIKKINSHIQQGCTILIISFDNVEIITAGDDRNISTGAKRNLLLSLAANEFCVSIDCDDHVYPYYISSIMEAIQNDVDCVTYNGIITTDGNDEIEWRLGKDFNNENIIEDNRNVYLRTVNHIAVTRTSIALMAGFPDISNGEDKGFSEIIKHLLKTEIRLEKCMYWYRYSKFNKTY